MSSLKPTRRDLTPSLSRGAPLSYVWKPDLHPRDRRGRFVDVFRAILNLDLGQSRDLFQIVKDSPNIEQAVTWRTRDGWETRAKTRTGTFGMLIRPDQVETDSHVFEDVLQTLDAGDPFPDVPKCPHCNMASPNGEYLPGHEKAHDIALVRLHMPSNSREPDNGDFDDPFDYDAPDVNGPKDRLWSKRSGDDPTRIRGSLSYKDPFKQKRLDQAVDRIYPDPYNKIKLGDNYDNKLIVGKTDSHLQLLDIDSPNFLPKPVVREIPRLEVDQSLITPGPTLANLRGFRPGDLVYTKDFKIFGMFQVHDQGEYSVVDPRDRILHDNFDIKDLRLHVPDGQTDGINLNANVHIIPEADVDMFGGDISTIDDAKFFDKIERIDNAILPDSNQKFRPLLANLEIHGSISVQEYLDGTQFDALDGMRLHKNKGYWHLVTKFKDGNRSDAISYRVMDPTLEWVATQALYHQEGFTYDLPHVLTTDDNAQINYYVSRRTEMVSDIVHETLGVTPSSSDWSHIAVILPADHPLYREHGMGNYTTIPTRDGGISSFISFQEKYGRSPLGHIAIAAHEILHGISNTGAHDHKSMDDFSKSLVDNLPWEEGVVEGAAHWLRPQIHARLRGEVNDDARAVYDAIYASSYYKEWVDTLEMMRQALHMNERDYWTGLLQTPITERADWLKEQIKKVHRSPDKHKDWAEVVDEVNRSFRAESRIYHLVDDTNGVQAKVQNFQAKTKPRLAEGRLTDENEGLLKIWGSSHEDLLDFGGIDDLAELSTPNESDVAYNVQVAEFDTNVIMVTGDATLMHSNGSQEQILHYSRTLDLENKVAEHMTFQVKPKFKKRGLAKRLLQSHIEWYDKHDFREINVDAGLAQGGYVWAKFGFDWRDDQERETHLSLISHKFAKHISTLKEHMQDNGAGGSDFYALDDWANEMTQYINESEHSWDLADIRVPLPSEFADYVDTNDPSVRTDWSAKQAMQGTGWLGVLTLDKTSVSRKQFDQYVSRPLPPIKPTNKSVQSSNVTFDDKYIGGETSRNILDTTELVPDELLYSEIVNSHDWTQHTNINSVPYQLDGKEGVSHLEFVTDYTAIDDQKYSITVGFDPDENVWEFIDLDMPINSIGTSIIDEIANNWIQAGVYFIPEYKWKAN